MGELDKPLTDLGLDQEEQLLRGDLDALSTEVHGIEAEIGRAVIGQDRVVREVLIAAFAGGHVLLEGVPGLGKTLLVRSLADVLGLGFSRVQCTPDLIPADVTGTEVLVEDESGVRHLRFRPGPIFSRIVLADEINRATPKTQSAFLEAMQESQVTIAGRTHALPRPFIVLATQNPIEMEGTFPLPEAQLDRFMFKVLLEYPGREELRRIVQQTTGPGDPELEELLSPERMLALRGLVRRLPVADDLVDAAVRTVRATHPDDEDAPEQVRRYVRFGAGPRAVQAIVLGAKVRALLEKRLHVAASDLRATVLPALRHRVLLNFEAHAASVSPDDLLDGLAERFLA